MEIRMRTAIILGSIILAFATSATANVQNEQWNDETCKQALLGFKDQDALSQTVKDLRNKISAGDKSSETFDMLSFYRDIEWYCLKR